MSGTGKRRGRPPKKGRLSLNRRQRLGRERRKKEKEEEEADGEEAAAAAAASCARSRRGSCPVSQQHLQSSEQARAPRS